MIGGGSLVLMRTYNSKPTKIEAYQFDGENLGPGMEWAHKIVMVETIDTGTLNAMATKDRVAMVRLHEGSLEQVEKGDWIAAEPDGCGYYPIRDVIFRQRYEVE